MCDMHACSVCVVQELSKARENGVIVCMRALQHISKGGSDGMKKLLQFGLMKKISSVRL